MQPFISNVQKFFTSLSNDIGIDLGTANTLLYLRGKGIILNEPSVVAINQKTGRVVAVGFAAKEMLGRTPGHLLAVRPLVAGVISDFEVTEEMLSYLLNRAESYSRRIRGPRVVVGVPCGVTNVEMRAVRDAARNGGAREVVLIEEPMAAALGMRLPVHDAAGNMIVDIGGGTTDVAIIALGGIVVSKNIRVAGDTFNSDIINYIKNEFKILIGERTAEDVKMRVAAVLPRRETLETRVRGRDMMSGLPKEVVITEEDVREAIGSSVETIITCVKELLEAAPPEVLSDVMVRGGYLTGGGALLAGFPELLSRELEIPVHMSDDPLTAVVRGTGVVLEDINRYRDIVVKMEDDSETNR